MSSVKTKQATDKAWDDGSDEETSDKTPNLNVPLYPDNIVNAEFIDSNGDILLRLDVLHVEKDDGRYYSLTYNLSTSSGTNGIFDFLDDYYSRKFGAFMSSKTIQALLTALHNVEKSFIKDRCCDLKEYCERITESAVEKVSKDSRFSNVLGVKIVDGYSMCSEANEIYHIKHFGISVGNHAEKFGKKLKDEFNKIVKDMETRKFCCVCVSRNDKLPCSFLIDPLIGLPLVIYNETFGIELMKNNFKGFIESDLFEMVGISDIFVDLWGVAPDTTIKSLMAIVGDDGEIKIDYTDDSMDNSDLFLGKYKTFKFNKSTYSNGKTTSTVIGY